MLESLARLRSHAWPLVIGMTAGGVAVVFAGPTLFWGLVALGLAAVLIMQFVTFQEPILRPPDQNPDEPLALLPPLTMPKVASTLREISRPLNITAVKAMNRARSTTNCRRDW